MRDGWVWTDDESTSDLLVMGWDDEDEDEGWEDDQEWDDEDDDEGLDEEWDDEEEDEDEDEDWEEWEEEFDEDEDDPSNRKKPGRPKWD